jgi:D-inositol-3-phosphate glycosyltransferase
VLGSADILATFHPADAAWVHKRLPHIAHINSALPELTLPFTHVTDRALVRREFGIAANDTLFLLFGFVRPYKGVDVLLDALARLDAADARLIIAGEVWRQSRRALARHASRRADARIIVHDRYVPNGEVGRYFDACDCVVLPYVRPVASGVAQLARRYGKPMIATTLMDGVGLDPAFDMCVPPGNAARLSEAMLSMCRRSTQISPSPDNTPLGPGISWSTLISGMLNTSHY